MKKILNLACLLLCLSACKDPEETKTTVFTLNFDSDYVAVGTDIWVLIHDSDGALLDYKLLDDGPVLTFSTSKNIPDNKISVTFFQHYLSNSDIVTSYMGVPVGQEWTLKTEPYDGFIDLPVLNNVTITGLGDVTSASVSAKNGGAQDMFLDPNTHQLYVNTSGAGRQLISIESSGELKYFWLLPYAEGQSVSFGDFANFDQTVQVSFPKCKPSLVVIGYEDGPAMKDQFVLFDDFKFGVERSSYNIGYLDEFDYYSTRLKINDGTYDMIYSSRGAKPTNISFPTGRQFDLPDKTISNFSMLHNQPFSSRHTRYQSVSKPGETYYGVYWNVYAPADEKIGQLPRDFQNYYPYLSLDRMVHMWTEVTIQGPSYTDFVDETFGGKEKPDFMESYSVMLH
jgi:hypothetical protein